ncbi:M20/M25/M40 family metallo-hydrolase [Jonesia quinghaiensis]|uniref:M20/M25/M40 family metallo-hydrolase n=1 Tax=Jonesia quinghaiensis TaxID=262806 RepID=UPI0004218BCE|nr:M20/M25/M40 family metallo-hydrolase [Jonesia quinghaiensis]
MKSASPQALRDVVTICRDLLRIDTSNFGHNQSRGERQAAEYVMELLGQVGLDAEIFESSPGRANVVTRISGSDPTRPALVVHGHLDVVPAQADEWSVDPFGGEIIDDMLWGRGAVDMKDMVAMMLAVLCDIKRQGIVPPRDLIFAFFADEEAGGEYGAHWTVQNKPELFEGASEAISEVGGYSTYINGQRAYLLQTAEKSLGWLQLIAHGTAGHGSQTITDNAVTHLSAALARIGQHPWEYHITPTLHALLTGVSELTGLPYDPHDPLAIDALLDSLGSTARFVKPTVHNTANPTQLTAGYKANVIPRTATGVVDARFLPGFEEEGMRILKELAGPNVSIDPMLLSRAVESPLTGNLVDSMTASIKHFDPDATVLPYMLSGGTDNKSLADLGIMGYGFAPLQLPEELDFPAMFHGVDERVPISALTFGVNVLTHLLQDC